MSSQPAWRFVRLLLMFNVLLALSASSVVASVPLLVHGRFSVAGPLAAFAVVFAVYNFDRLADASPGEGRSTEERAKAVRRARPALRVLIPLSLGVAALCALGRGNGAILWTAAFPAFGMAYVMLPLPFRHARRIKDIPYFKCFYTAACWALFVGVGMAYSGRTVDPTVAWFALFIGVRMFASTYLGDIRDLADDAEAGIKTIAGAVGVEGSHRLLRFVHRLSAAWVLLGLLSGVLPTAAWVLLGLIPIGAGFRAAYERWPQQHAVLFELYDLEMALYAPCLWLALA